MGWRRHSAPRPVAGYKKPEAGVRLTIALKEAYGGHGSMRRRLAPIAALGAAGALAAACGSADNPSQVVTSALDAVQTTPLQASFYGNFSLDVASLQGLPTSIQSQVAQLGNGGTVSGTLLQASSSRRELEMRAAGHAYDLVQYDGHGYMREDGGDWDEFSSTFSSSQTLNDNQVGIAVWVVGFTDQGPVSIIGQATELYHATLTSTSLTELLEALAVASGSAPNSSASRLADRLGLLSSFVTVSNAAADVWINTASGNLVKASLSGSLSVNVSPIASALAGQCEGGSGASPATGGTVRASLSLTVQISDYGGPVVVTKPVVAATTLP